MPLDPAAAVLQSQVLAIGPNVAETSMSIPEIRAVIRERVLTRLTHATPVANVAEYTVTREGEPDGIPVRVYWPLGGHPVPPVVVFFHGGGWTLCDLDTHDDLCRNLCNDFGAIVMSVDYRLAPEHPYPAAFDDGCTAVGWAQERASDFGGDPRRVVVAGDSAGGNIAAAVALAGRHRRSPQVFAQILMYPVLDYAFDTPSYLSKGTNNLLTTTDMRWYWNQYLQDPSDGASPYASPLKAGDLTGLPPTVMALAEFDPLHDEGVRYADRLKESGVHVTLLDVGGVFHGFLSMRDVLPVADLAFRDFAAEVRQVLAT